MVRVVVEIFIHKIASHGTPFTASGRELCGCEAKNQRHAEDKPSKTTKTVRGHAKKVAEQLFADQLFHMSMEYVDEKEYQMENESKRVDNALALDLISVLKPSRATNKRNAIIYLFYTVLVVSVGTWLLVYAIEKMGSGSYSFMELNLRGINLPTIFVSLILGAAASSVPDTILSIKDAVKGNHKDAISNCIGINEVIFG